MAETTYIVGNKDYQRILMNAVGIVIDDERNSAATRHNITEALASKGTDPDIVVTVNGIEVPFLEAFESALDHHMKHIDTIAYEKAEEMLKRSGIGDMIESMRELGSQFCDRLIALGYDIKQLDDDY